MLHMSLVLLGAGREGCAFWWCVALLLLFAPEDGRIGPKHVELNK